MHSIATSDTGENIVFKDASEHILRIMPTFGAHPLTQVFNDNPILLIEGDSDYWVWHTAIQSSEGALCLHPCSVDSKDVMNRYEKELATLLPSIYDAPRAYSLRDRDKIDGDITDEGCVVRMRLVCQEIENLLLCDEVLDANDISWSDYKKRIAEWLLENPDHPKHAVLAKFSEGGFDRKSADIKDARLVLVKLFMTNKPWEVIVGKAIAEAVKAPRKEQLAPDSALEYLGEKFQKQFLPVDAEEPAAH